MMVVALEYVFVRPSVFSPRARSRAKPFGELGWMPGFETRSRILSAPSRPVP